MIQKTIFAAILGAVVFTGGLFAGSARVAHWDSQTYIRISHLGTGTSADCTVTYYSASGSVAATSTHTFTAQYQSQVFNPPGSGGGHALIACDEQVIAHAYYDASGEAFSVPIFQGMPF
ncbi:MAG: hypothetical protein RIF32_12600 [Leptospirales bacterium]|jgi:hypothetical protein